MIIRICGRYVNINNIMYIDTGISHEQPSVKIKFVNGEDYIITCQTFEHREELCHTIVADINDAYRKNTENNQECCTSKKDNIPDNAIRI